VRPQDALPVEWSSSALSSGKWTGAGSLILLLPFEANEKSRSEWSLAFSLVNPSKEHGPVQPSVGAEYKDSKGLSNVNIHSTNLIRDARKYTQLSYVCNTSHPNYTISGWGHDDNLSSIPTAETPYTYLCGQYEVTRALEESRTGQDQDRMPLRVRPAQFLEIDIGQSSPHPCAINFITVTLATSVPLLINSRYTGIDCQPDITIKGLLGTQTPDSAVFTLLEASAAIDALAAWTYSTGTVVVKLQSDLVAAQNATFKFTVTNKATPQDSPNVQAVTSLHSGALFETMIKDGRSLPDVWENPTGTRQPLLILAGDLNLS